LIEDTTLLKDKEYMHSGYVDMCTITYISLYMGKKVRGTCSSTSMIQMRPFGTEFSGHQILMKVRVVLRLLEDNPYIPVFWSLGNIENLDEYRIELNTNIAVVQRRYNAPTIS
jgi:hypothetical protein